MATTRREFLAAVGGAGMGGLMLPAMQAAAEDAADKPQPKRRPSMSMVIETVYTEGLAQLSYLVGDTATGKAAVIDPRRDVDVYLELAGKHQLTITHALETHIHADFVSGCRELADRTGTARIFLSGEGGAEYGFRHETLEDGDQIDLGRVILTARHTPGHTPEHLSFLAAENIRPDQPFAVFSGDCLFADSAGRPDLLGDEQTGGLAKELFKSLREFYLKLDDDVRVHPGHGAGSPCGANIGDRLVTTIGYERKHNPALQIADEAEFVEFILFTAPPEPRYYKRLKQVNADGPDVLRRFPLALPLTAEQFARAIEGGKAQLVDNRQMLAFGGGHIAGAMNIGPRPELSIWAGWMLDPGEPTFLILRDEQELDAVQRQLLRVGYDGFGGYLLGGMEAWCNRGFAIQRVGQITVRELDQQRRTGDLQVLDVRTPNEWQSGHVPGAIYIFLPELEQKLDRLDPSKPVAVYCDSGYRASLGASLLKRHGFDVLNVVGSWKAWSAQDLPVERPQQRRKASQTDLA